MVSFKSLLFSLYWTGNALGIRICGCRCILESYGSQNQRVHIVLEASKSAGAKGDVPKICGFVHTMHVLTHSLLKYKSLLLLLYWCLEFLSVFNGQPICRSLKFEQQREIVFFYGPIWRGKLSFKVELSLTVLLQSPSNIWISIWAFKKSVCKENDFVISFKIVVWKRWVN